jgi:hypothetical protein
MGMAGASQNDIKQQAASELYQFATAISENKENKADRVEMGGEFVIGDHRYEVKIVRYPRFFNRDDKRRAESVAEKVASEAEKRKEKKDRFKKLREHEARRKEEARQRKARLGIIG